MLPHIKLAQSGRIAPRMHLYDATRGTTRRIHIGYVGPHLVNTRTN